MEKGAGLVSDGAGEYVSTCVSSKEDEDIRGHVLTCAAY